jgi:hypothetical protein
MVEGEVLVSFCTFFCMFLYLFVWCHCNFHLKLELQAPLYELSTKMSAVWKLFVKRTANWLRLLHRAITIFIP